MTLLPDLSLGPGEYVHVAHLDHGLAEVPEELAVELACGDTLDAVLGGGVEEERRVGAEETPPLGDVAVVAGIRSLEATRVHLRQHSAVINALALEPQLVSVLAVQRRVDEARGTVLAGGGVEAVGERRAVRRAEHVGAGEDDEVLEVEAPGGKDLGEQRDVAGGRGQLVACLRGTGHPTVSPSQRHRPEGSFSQHDSVAGHEGEHVGAGDDARARGLELGLHPLHGAEPSQALVRLGVLLRHVAVGGFEQDRGITTPDEAVVEMKTEERAGEAGRGGDDLGHLLADDLLSVGACLAVEADL